MSGCGCGGAAPAAARARAQTRGRKAILPDRIRSAADLDRALAALGGEVIRSGRTAGGGSTGRGYGYDDDTGGAMPTSTQADQTDVDVPEKASCDDYYGSSRCDDDDSPIPCTSAWTSQTVVAADTTIVRASLLSTTDQSNLELVVQQAMTHFNIPAMAVAVLSPAESTLVPGPLGGQKWHAPRLVYASGFTHHPAFDAHGFPDEDPARNPERPMTSQYVRFRVASVSKILTALGVMRVQKLFPGDFSIDDYVTATTGVEFSQGVLAPIITARHLLSHSSGLARDPDTDERVGEANQRLPVTTEDLLDFAANSLASKVWELKFAPGSNTQYSSYGMLVLGQVIEAISGERYEVWIRREVAGSCQMSATRSADPLESGYYEATYYANRIACNCECDSDCERAGDNLYPMKTVMSSRYNGTPDVLDGRSCVRSTYGGFNHQAHMASSGWLLTVRDMARLMRMFHRCLQGDADWFLTKAEAEEMVTRQTLPKLEDNIGLGWYLDDGGAFFHFGRRCGTTSALWSRVPNAPDATGDYSPSLCWTTNTDLSRECRAEINDELRRLIEKFAFPSGDLL